MAWFLLALAGCVASSDGTGLLERRAFDTALDRVRVLGVRATPEVPVWGQPFTVDALTVSPGGAPTITVEGCGWDEARPVRDVTCFEFPELVATLGGGVPLTITRAPFEAFPPAACTDPGAWSDTGAGEPSTDCVAPLHLRFTATEDGASDAQVVSLPSLAPTSPPPVGDPVGELAVTTTVDDEGVAIEVTLPIPDGWRPATNDDAVARWYASGGTFRGTGRTTGVVDGTDWRAENRLMLDAGTAGPVRIAVVVAVRRGVWSDAPAGEAAARIDMRWATASVQRP